MPALLFLFTIISAAFRKSVRANIFLFVIAFAFCSSGYANDAPSDTIEAGEKTTARPTIRFLLTFDDGPSISTNANPTLSILDDLSHNSVQSGIKAIFFVQTRAVNGGGTALGRQIMQRENAEGHVLGFHTATARHANHRYLTAEEFEQSLVDGIADITAITGVAPKLVRPPFWNYDQRTFSFYEKHGLHVLLTDLSANDGKTIGVNFSLRRRSYLLAELTKVRDQIHVDALAPVNGDIPIIVCFHDINTYTARHMQEYLEILMDSARELGLRTAAKPFYDDRHDIELAALSRTVRDGSDVVRIPGFWNWLWQ